MRRIYITESQAKKILGEDFTSYLPDIAQGNKQPNNAHFDEVGTKEPDEDGNRYGGPVGDKIAHEESPRIPYGLRTASARITEENKMLQKSFTLNGQKVPTNTINGWKHQKKNGKNLSKGQEKMIKRVDGNRQTIRNSKNTMRQLGISVDTKQVGNGMAHTKKINTNVSITYTN